jgi:flagellar biosynthesis chaperone FliJ
MSVMENLVRLITDWLKPPEPTEEEKAIEKVHAELRNVRRQIRFIEHQLEHVEVDHYEYMSQMLNALREHEHVLINEAKQLYGCHVKISTSIREYQQSGVKLPWH